MNQAEEAKSGVGVEDIPVKEGIPIRLQLSGDLSSTALQYAAFALGLLALSAAGLNASGKIGNGSAIWWLDGLF